MRVSSEPSLPEQEGPWLKGKKDLLVGDLGSCELNLARARAQLSSKPWVLPARQHLFFTDMHADGDALLASLVASGGVRRTGDADTDFTLSDAGRRARFVFGGDYFDKGPSNLRLLRVLRHLQMLGADLVMLAGNHDVRTYLGICYAEDRDPLRRHLFVRMGRKGLTLLHEIFCDYVEGEGPRLSDEEVRDRLFPGEAWYESFAENSAGTLRPERLHKEKRRIREKTREIESNWKAMGLTLNDLYQAVSAARRLFLHAEGEFSWLFSEMKLAYQSGSFLFVHAGVDDISARLIQEEGIDGLNDAYVELLHQDPFECYNGPLGNCFRTKYREGDFPFTAEGARHLRRSGIYAIVHGHRNLLQGQKLTMRHGVLNIECDASVDCNTRAQEGLEGPGAAVTMIEGNRITGLSTDHRHKKVLRPSDFGASSVITLDRSSQQIA